MNICNIDPDYKKCNIKMGPKLWDNKISSLLTTLKQLQQYVRHKPQHNLTVVFFIAFLVHLVC